MSDKLLSNDKHDFTVNSDYSNTHYIIKGTLSENMIYNPVDESIEYMFDKLMKALPNDTARLFFLQSELLSDELKDYRTNKIVLTSPNNFKYKYYREVKTKLNQLKEQYEQTKL